MIEEKTRVPNPTRYRFTDADGRVYAPFRLRSGVSIRDVIAQAFPGEAHDTDWGLQEARVQAVGAE